MFHFTRGITFGMDVADLLELESALQCSWKTITATNK
jgi:hypothetical protein